MEAPDRFQKKRRAQSDLQARNSSMHSQYISDGSPTPLTTSSKSVPSGIQNRRPRSSQTVSIGWKEEQDALSHHTSSLDIVAECIETKTVTTTTTTKRTYPSLSVSQQSLANLDSKEYPLASKDTPPELTFFKLHGQVVDFVNDDQLDLASTFDDSQNSFSSSFYRADQEFSNGADAYRTPDLENRDSKRAEGSKPKQHSNDFRRSLRANGTERSTKDGRQLRTGERARRSGLGMHLPNKGAFPTTPDMSELEAANNNQIRAIATSFFPDTYTPQSGLSQNDSFDELESPSDTANSESFASAVATPPIADSDLEPVEGIGPSFSHSSGQRPTVNTSAAQNASLPSPGLSPSYHNEDWPNHAINDAYENHESPPTEVGDSQAIIDDDRVILAPHSSILKGIQRQSQERSALNQSNIPSILETRSMIESFDSMPNDMKSFMMYQFLRRCSKKTLHIIADVVNPALKCDFIQLLPLELSLLILSFLDHKDLCRAAQVSRQWRNVIDSNESGWKELLDRDGYVLPLGELEKAIKQGWGWQDPYGPDGYEQDLSNPDQPLSSDLDMLILGGLKTENESARKGRSRKRKASQFTTGSDRTKRRAVGHEFTEKAQEILAKYPYTAKFDKSEGPLTAASAAAAAVPDPGEALDCLPSLRKLHLFKSLYRRHYMLQQNWTSGKVAPHHFAFPAHPSHVITCLQFDDDKILTGSDDTLIHVYDTRTGLLRKKLEGHEGGVWALQYEGNVLVSGSTDRSVRVWDIEKGLCTQVFHGHTSTVRCLQILMPEPTGRTEKGQPVMLPESPLIITGSRDSQLRVWKLPEQGSKRYIPTGPPANEADCPYFVRGLLGHAQSVRAIAAHQDTLVSGSYDNTVRVWKISTGETVHRLQGHSMKVYSVVLDHQRNRCISGSMDNFVKIWCLDTGVCLFTLEGHTSLVGLLDLRDERLVSAAADSTLRIWDPENGQCKSTLTAHTGAITCFQHDGQKVISGSDRTLKMWDIKTGECIKDLLTDLSGVWQVKFDERRCVAAVQRDNLTFVEVIDFGASRDGIPSERRKRRVLLRGSGENGGVVDEELEET